jgi:hypothetical protein
LMWSALWVATVIAIAAIRWWPFSLGQDTVQAGECAFILRLPEDGVLADAIGQGTHLTLAVSPAAPPPKPDAQPPKPGDAKAAPAPEARKPPQTVDASKAAPPQMIHIEDTRVLGKTCPLTIDSTSRTMICYAIIAVPQASIDALMTFTGPIWAWIRHKPGNTSN